MLDALKAADGLRWQDGKWVIASLSRNTPVQLVLLPTGTGEGKPLTNDGINYSNAHWFPDGTRLLFQGSEPDPVAHIWEASSGSVVRQWKGDESAVMAIAFQHRDRPPPIQYSWENEPLDDENPLPTPAVAELDGMTTERPQ